MSLPGISSSRQNAGKLLSQFSYGKPTIKLDE
jgi:hypothetical protein